MFRLGEGCAKTAPVVSVFAEKGSGDFCVKEVSRGRIGKCIGVILKSTRNAVFPSYVTTDVQQELLNGDAFDFMRLIKLMTDGKTRAIYLWLARRRRKVVNQAAEERLKRIARFMDKRCICPFFDTMRSNARIRDDENVVYVETLDRLKFAERGVRVTVSIQGVDGISSDHPSCAYSRKRAQELLRVVKENFEKKKDGLLRILGVLSRIRVK